MSRKEEEIVVELDGPRVGSDWWSHGIEACCCDAFRWCDHEQEWGIPYYTGAKNDGSVATSPSSPWFAWLPATKHESDDAVKVAGIVALGDSIEARFK